MHWSSAGPCQKHLHHWVVLVVQPLFSKSCRSEKGGKYIQSGNVLFLLGPLGPLAQKVFGSWLRIGLQVLSNPLACLAPDIFDY